MSREPRFDGGLDGREQLGRAGSMSRRDAMAWLTAQLGAPLVLAATTACRSAVDVPAGDTTNEAETPRRIRAYLSRLEGFGFAGAVLVARDRKLLLGNGYGLADRANEARWDADTIFDVGSVAKQFTAAAVLALEADGKLATSDSIATHLPGVPADKAAITIHQLLTHTSGLEDGFGGDYESASRDSLLQRAMESTLARAPGEKHAYSNAGYSVLAAIVEIVSGTDFDRFVRERLFRPAGMSSSGYELNHAQLVRLARGYRDGEDARLPERAAAVRGQMWNLIGNGGLYSTVTDMHAWMLALQGDQVLPATTRHKLFQPQVLVTADYAGSGRPLHYAYGWYVWEQASGKTLIWHLGGNGITNAAIRWHVQDETWIVYASNVSEFHDPRYPVPAVERMLTGADVEVPPAVVRLAEEQLARFAGTYRASSGAKLNLAPREGFLDVGGEGQEAFAFAVDGDWLASPEFQTLNARTAELVEDSRTSRFDVVARAFAPQFTLQELEAGETAFWKKRRDRLGDYVRTRVLGTMRPESRRYIGRTIVAIDFSGGTTWREYFWTPQSLVGDLGPLDKPPRSRFFPVSESCFVMFDPAEAKSARFSVESVGGDYLLTLAGSLATLRLER